jgi:hypothetical protein
MAMAKCEAYEHACNNPATKLVEIRDDKGGWRTMIFCDHCYERLLKDVGVLVAREDIKL